MLGLCLVAVLAVVVPSITASECPLNIGNKRTTSVQQLAPKLCEMRLVARLVVTLLRVLHWVECCLPCTSGSRGSNDRRARIL
jgi:hypothetical protein